jgi:hypothetical protein
MRNRQDPAEMPRIEDRKERVVSTEGTEAPFCGCCRRVPISYLGLDLDEPVEGWLAFFEKRAVIVMDDHLGRASVARYVLADLIAEHSEREARLAEEAAERAAAQLPVVASRGILPPREDMSAYETMMAAGGTSPQQEFGRIPPPHFLEEEIEEGQKRLAAEREAVRQRKEEAK